MNYNYDKYRRSRPCLQGTGGFWRTPRRNLLHGIVRKTERSPVYSWMPALILGALCKTEGSVAQRAARSDDIWCAHRRKVFFKNVTRSILYCFPTAAEVNGVSPKAIWLCRKPNNSTRPFLLDRIPSFCWFLFMIWSFVASFLFWYHRCKPFFFSCLMIAAGFI